MRKYTLIILYFCGLLICPELVAQEEKYILGNSSNQAEGVQTWNGSIYDADNEALIGVVIRNKDNSITGYTDAFGSYEIKLPKGNYKFEISAIGYASKFIELQVFSSGSLDLVMDKDNIVIEGVVVKSEADDRGLKEIVPGVKRMDIQELESQSKFFGEVDVMRSLQSVSGVSSVGEGASGFNVRGGNADQNLILQDGHLIFNPSHALGFFSLFHPDLVNYIDLYKGALPGKYGGRLSSVLAVDTKEGDATKYRIKGGAGLVSSRLSAEGPIIKDRLSFIVGARTSYADWIFNLAKNPELGKSSAYFGDITAKLSGRIGEKASIGASYLLAKDDFQLGGETRFKYQTQSFDFYYKQLIGDRFNISLIANSGEYESSLFDLIGNDKSQFTNSIFYNRASLNALYQISENYKLNFGAEATLYDIAPGSVIPIEVSTIIPQELDPEKGIEYGYYVENQFTLFGKLEFSAGLRFSNYDNLGPDLVYQYDESQIKEIGSIVDSTFYGSSDKIVNYNGLEPRVSARWEFNPKTSLKLAYSRTNQYIFQISNTASATPIDLWQLANPHFKPQQSDNYSIGLYKNFKENTYTSSIESFYRNIFNAVDYKDFAQILLNRNLETEILSGDGLAYGLELNFNKKKGRLTWDLNYTYSRSLRQVLATENQLAINRGEWYASNYDIPHVINFNLVKKIKKRSSLAVNFTYRSGRPTTAPVSSFNTENIFNIPIYSDRNQFRIPDFHRLDLSYTIGPFGDPNKSWKHFVSLSVYNVYGRKNPYSVFFKQSPFDNVKAIRVATLGSVFPAISYNFTIE